MRVFLEHKEEMRRAISDVYPGSPAECVSIGVESEIVATSVVPLSEEDTSTATVRAPIDVRRRDWPVARALERVDRVS